MMGLDRAWSSDVRFHVLILQRAARISPQIFSVTQYKKRFELGIFNLMLLRIFCQNFALGANIFN